MLEDKKTPLKGDKEREVSTDGSRVTQAADPIARLAIEHGIITSVTNAFERYAACLLLGNAEPHDFVRFVVFFREFAGIMHHQKEDDIAFSALAAHGYEQDSGPRAHLRSQHEHEQMLVLRLLRAATEDFPSNDKEAERLASLVAGFCAAQRAHVATEMEHQYPALRNLLTPEQAAQVSRKLQIFDQEHNQLGRLDWLLELAESLEIKYGDGVVEEATNP